MNFTGMVQPHHYVNVQINTKFIDNKILDILLHTLLVVKTNEYISLTM